MLCNGKTLAFQARDTGSIPVTRSKFHFPKYRLHFSPCNLRKALNYMVISIEASIGSLQAGCCMTVSANQVMGVATG